MAKLKAKLTKTEFDASGALQEFYVLSGDDYILDADGVEDVSGLKSALEREKAERRTAKELLAQFEGLNPEDAKKALAEMAKAEEEKLADKGKYEELLAQREAKWKADLEKEQSEKSSILANLKRQQLSNFLVTNGVLPDRAKYALSELDSLVDLQASENEFKLTKKDGIGDAKELDELINGLKTSSPFLFAPNGASGSGASGSEGNGDNKITVTSSNVVKPSVAQFDALADGSAKVT